ncbi:NEDD4-binding protein 2-like protein [Corchorus capsularis]|uniref:NEDD4-binding protein 2-like protein n=1 Tax=Corchorus capsularis TaxID=210143 RepID=A0A1R3KJB0_COCAP|nr:NEDD4-binding protein 2-like protein [Corchorus capsularis]
MVRACPVGEILGVEQMIAERRVVNVVQHADRGRFKSPVAIVGHVLALDCMEMAVVPWRTFEALVPTIQILLDFFLGLFGGLDRIVGINERIVRRDVEEIGVVAWISNGSFD